MLEPCAKSRKISPKVRKNMTKFKSKKEEIWKAKKAKKSTKYKEVDQKSSEKVEQILRQKIVQEKLRPLKTRFIYATSVL